MPEEKTLVLPFVVSYDGRLADQHSLRAEEFGQSIIGASKLYTAVAHYSMFGFVPRGNYKKDFVCYAKPTTPGSVEQIFFIAPILGQYALHADLYNQAISLLFGKTIDAVKKMWTRPSETHKVVETLSQTLIELGQQNAQVQAQLVQALGRANDNQATVHAKLVETLPALAAAMRPHGRALVAPVGTSCRTLSQGFESGPSVITEVEAEAIRGDQSTEIDDVNAFRALRISEINVNTGHCILDIEGMGDGVTGRITDPVLAEPNNIYTQALNSHSALEIEAKAVRKGGQIVRLFVSNARQPPATFRPI